MHVCLKANAPLTGGLQENSLCDSLFREFDLKTHIEIWHGQLSGPPWPGRTARVVRHNIYNYAA